VHLAIMEDDWGVDPSARKPKAKLSRAKSDAAKPSASAQQPERKKMKTDASSSCGAPEVHDEVLKKPSGRHKIIAIPAVTYNDQPTFLRCLNGARQITSAPPDLDNNVLVGLTAGATDHTQVC
jgi:hypothetical protein